MKTTISQKEAYQEAYSLLNTPSTEGLNLTENIKHALIAAKNSVKNNISRFIKIITLGKSHTIVKIENLHDTCRKTNPPARRVFILYVKGYSMEEITQLSGTKRKHIIPTIHSILSTIRKERYIS